MPRLAEGHVVGLITCEGGVDVVGIVDELRVQLGMEDVEGEASQRGAPMHMTVDDK